MRIQGYDRVGATLPRAPHAGGVPDDVAFARSRQGRARPSRSPRDPSDAVRLAGGPAICSVTTTRSRSRTRCAPKRGSCGRGSRRACSMRSPATRRVASRRWRCSRSAPRSGWPTRSREHRKLGFALAGPAGRRVGRRNVARSTSSTRRACSTRCSTISGSTGWPLGPTAGPPFHPGRSATVSIDGRHVGVVGEIHPRVAEPASRSRAGSRVVRGRARPARRPSLGGPFAFRDVPRFPPVRRDLAFVAAGTRCRRAACATTLEAAGAPLVDRMRAVRRVPRRAAPERGARSPRLRASSSVPPTAPSPTTRLEPVVDRIVAAVAAERRRTPAHRLSAGRGAGSRARLRAMARDYLSVDDLVERRSSRRVLDLAAR